MCFVEGRTLASPVLDIIFQTYTFKKFHPIRISHRIWLFDTSLRISGLKLLRILNMLTLIFGGSGSISDASVEDCGRSAAMRAAMANLNEDNASRSTHQCEEPAGSKWYGIYTSAFPPCILFLHYWQSGVRWSSLFALRNILRYRTHLEVWIETIQEVMTLPGNNGPRKASPFNRCTC